MKTASVIKEQPYLILYTHTCISSPRILKLAVTQLFILSLYIQKNKFLLTNCII